MYILQTIFVSVFLFSLVTIPALALDIKVILPPNIKVVPVKLNKMIKNLENIIPSPVSEVLDNELILDFSQKLGNLNIKCPADLIKEHSESVNSENSESINQEENININDIELIPAKNLTAQYVEVPSFTYNWNNTKAFPLGLILIHEGFLYKAISSFPSCYKIANYFSTIDYLEGQILRSIGRIWNRSAKLQSSFLASKQRLRQFSDSVLFSHLDNWGSGFEANINKNTWKGDKLKLVDPAVRISPLQNFSLEDSFSIYFEKFLSDKDFACKKPATHMYFKKIMNFAPFGIEECSNLNTTIYEGFLNKNVFYLEPSRIKEIHILLAGPGRAVMSRWGHTMFRLVVCKKGQSGKDCAFDSLDDIVLGFRAHVSGLEIEHIKGVFGKYPSLLFPAKMANIKNEYNRTELRDLTSIPINFTSEERKFFLYKTLQDFWAYKGKYYFFSNNCATESNDFLMGSFLSSPKKAYLLHKLLGTAVTPTGSISSIRNAKSKPYYKALKNTFDLTKLNKKNRKANKSYVSASYRPALQKLVNLLMPLNSLKNKKLQKQKNNEQLVSAIIKKQKLDIKSFPKVKAQDYSVEIFSSLPIKKRVELYKKLLVNKPKYAVSFTLLETYIKKVLEENIKSRTISVAINTKKLSPAAKKVLEAFQKVIKSQVQVYSFTSYGVPSSVEVKNFLTYLDNKYELKESDMTLEQGVEIVEGEVWNWQDELSERSEHLAQFLFPEWTKELKEVKNLLKSLRNYSKTKTLSF